MRPFFRALLLIGGCIVFGVAPTNAEIDHGTLHGLTSPPYQSQLLTVSEYDRTIRELQAAFEDFSGYLYERGRSNADQSVIFHKDNDYPWAYDLKELAFLYGAIREVWGNQIIHWQWPDFIDEHDPNYLGFLRRIEKPYLKLGSHLNALNSAYQNAALRAKTLQPTGMSTEQLDNSIRGGYRQIVRDQVDELRRRGEHPRIRTALRSSDPTIRFTTAWAVADLKAEEFALDMKGLLSDTHESVRAEAVAYFTLTSDRNYVDAIGKMLWDPSPVVREWAADYVGAVKAYEYRSRLRELLTDPHEAVRDWARKSLEKMPES